MWPVMTHTETKLTLTRKQLSAWNSSHYKWAGISFNENVNRERGLPNPETRDFLRKLHSDTFGICEPAGRLTWKQVQEAMAEASR